MDQRIALVLGVLSFVTVGLDVAVAALCAGWPRGELWPLDERWASATMAGAAVAASAAGLLTLHLGAAGALSLFLSGSLLAVVAGLCGAIGSNVPRARAVKGAVFAVALAAGAPAVAHVQAVRVTGVAAWLPAVRIVPESLAAYAALVAVCEAAEAATILRRWPRAEARAVLVAGPAVFALGAVDFVALALGHAPLVGAVTASALVAAFIGWRGLTQLRVALRGIEGRVPGYALKRFLGAGGMAEVFLAEAVGLLGRRRLVAVKRVRRDLVGEQALCEMFVEEARLAATLHHANIVEVHAVGEGAGRPFIAMELVDGLPLAAVVARRAARSEPISLDAIVAVGVALCGALGYAHALRDERGRPLGLVHRDVTPQNVLLSREGDVKLIDFGIARARTHAARTAAGFVRGKIAYSAPEQLRGGEMDGRVDLFALGVVLYEMAALRAPFAGDTDGAIVEAIGAGRHLPLGALRPGAGALEDVVERALAVDRDARYADAASLEAALRAVAGGAAPGPAAVRELVASVIGDAPSVTASTSRLRGAAEQATVVDRRAAPPPGAPQPPAR